MRNMIHSIKQTIIPNLRAAKNIMTAIAFLACHNKFLQCYWFSKIGKFLTHLQ